MPRGEAKASIETFCNLSYILRIMKNIDNIEYLSYSERSIYCTMHLRDICFISLNPYCNHMRKVLLYYYPHFNDEETESENIICLRSQSW